MQANYKLKKAVAIALSIIVLNAQQQALAMGLGEIDVKSHLGEPLKAHIKIVGAEDLKPSDLTGNTCFRVGNEAGGLNQISSARFTLGKLISGEGTLTVTSADVINEPIANLSIIAECGGNVRRDYVLLIDPLLTAETEKNVDIAPNIAAEAAELPIVQAVKTQPKQVKSTTVSTNKKTSKNNQLKANKALAANIVLHVPGGSTQANLSDAPKEVVSTPRLSISGGLTTELNPNEFNPNNINLRLDRALRTTPDANAPVLAQEAEMQDEVMAMNNRLAHLTAQVTTLQNQNLTLAAENKAKDKALLENKPFSFNWLVYAATGALALAVAYAATHWWRRRQQAKSDADWTNLNSQSIQSESFAQDEAFFDEKMNQNTDHNADNYVEISALDASEFKPGLLQDDFIVTEEDIDNTVLDHADVFLSHGRTALAIQLLQNHLLDYPKQSVTIWLFLLDLLSKENMQAVYEQTALECKEHFNIKIADFSVGDVGASHTLESYPRLSQGLQNVWGTPEALVFLDDLIYNNRLEPRVGFDKNLIEELLTLKELAKQALSTAEVIQMDEKKLAINARKETQIAAKKAEKLKAAEAAQLEMVKAAELAKNAEAAKGDETAFEFKFVDWK